MFKAVFLTVRTKNQSFKKPINKAKNGNPCKIKGSRFSGGHGIRTPSESFVYGQNLLSGCIWVAYNCAGANKKSPRGGILWGLL